MQRFTIILKGHNVLSEEVVDRHYGRCDEVSAGTCDGIGRVHFDRPAASLNAATDTALQDLRAVDLEATRIEITPEDVASAGKPRA